MTPIYGLNHAAYSDVDTSILGTARLRTVAGHRIGRPVPVPYDPFRTDIEVFHEETGDAFSPSPG